MNKKKKVVIKRDECIACGMCESIAPEIFTMGEDGMATTKKDTNLNEEELELVQEAIEQCPVEIISLEEVDENE